MAMVVGNNIAALNTTRNMNLNNSKLNRSLEKLSSGYRINNGKDGPADLVISEKLRSQINGINRAVRNTSEANNVLSIAEGALNEMNSILKTMKALAVHASNDGVVSADQIEADQAEMDSAIQSLERISNSTRYSGDQLINGSKELTYSTSTTVKGTQNNALLDKANTNFSQIYKTSGFAVTLSFNGAKGADSVTAIGDADMSKQASKAYLEIDPIDGTLSQIDENGLTKSQSFVLTGSLGSRQFSFGQGTSIDQIVSAIHGYAGTTGVDAALTFNSTQEINICSGVDLTISGTTLTSTRTSGSLTVFDNYTVNQDGTRSVIVSGVSATMSGVHFGFNTDGQGNIYVKVLEGGAYELYKDSSLSKESLVGIGTSSGGAMTEMNNSGLSGLTISISDDAKFGDVAYISFGNISLSSGASNAVYHGTMAPASGATANYFQMSGSIAAGVKLGINTDSAGTIYTKVVVDESGNGTVYAYNDASMSADSLVAMSEEDITLTSGTAVILNQIWNDERTASTGLSLHLNIGGAFATEGSYEGRMTFTNLGARVYASEYGSDEFIQVQQLEGGLFTYYDQQDKASSVTLIEGGTTQRVYGQDATVNINGQQMKTVGLTMNLATSDITAKFVFNEGKTGTTTIAQVGYAEGSIFSKNESLTYTGWENDSHGTGFSAMLNNACHSTKETVGKFQGGMQLQLGESSNDADRTVISLKGMGIDNLGRTTVTRAFDSGSAVLSTKTLSLRDVFGGGIASLENDPVLSMDIIDQAISDVSTVRAQIGAVQTNMLQTNSNNLEVTIENLTKTESAIRDTDMASEMTAFTNAQILSQAGVSMLSQANSQAQNVLSLLR